MVQHSLSLTYAKVRKVNYKYEKMMIDLFSNLNYNNLAPIMIDVAASNSSFVEALSIEEAYQAYQNSRSLLIAATNPKHISEWIYFDPYADAPIKSKGWVYCDHLDTGSELWAKYLASHEEIKLKIFMSVPDDTFEFDHQEIIGIDAPDEDIVDEDEEEIIEDDDVDDMDEIDNTDDISNNPFAKAFLVGFFEVGEDTEFDENDFNNVDLNKDDRDNDDRKDEG